MSPAAALAALVSGPVLVDNDVNWAARAEREVRSSERHRAGRLRLSLPRRRPRLRGRQRRRGPPRPSRARRRDRPRSRARLLGRPVPFITVFAQLGLRHAGSTAIDVTTVRDQLAVARRTSTGTHAGCRNMRRTDRCYRIVRSADHRDRWTVGHRRPNDRGYPTCLCATAKDGSDSTRARRR